MQKLSGQLALDSCPYCGRANPTFNQTQNVFPTEGQLKINPRWWGVYICKSCGGVVIAAAPNTRNDSPYLNYIDEIYPAIQTISDLIPEKPRAFLTQAHNSLHAPSGAIMLCASAVDAMLKAKNYKEGKLYTRIQKAAADHLITEEMSKWAHQIRLDANDERHADENASLPSYKDANLAFEFAISFAEYLFVLPSKVSRGITESVPKP
ncbi:MAG: hypothetical protein A2Y07_10075 [Planctomycetes bacterium GWF2_50_10]|nr:MAG: hypothetical protein A2Y07_10075 [Planctomycetes bacterium GWF2_50_10]